MTKKSTLKRLIGFTVLTGSVMLVSGIFSETLAQRDPFEKPGFMRPKVQAPPPKPKVVKVEKTVVPYAAPTVEARIEYFKRMREAAAASGAPLPKVTSVLMLSEMAVSGIFKTPRGYAAIVEATPIKLSYTIFPGEKFFDGQLVAVDENHLVFKKVTKVAEGKFVSSVENKGLKAIGKAADTTATAPAPVEKTVETAANTPSAKPAKPAPNPFLSPVDEMNQMPAQKEDSAKPAKKPTKVARIRK